MYKKRRQPKKPRAAKRKKNGFFDPAPEKTPPSYRRAHWGREPNDVRTVNVGEPSDNRKLIGLGAIHSVVYVTEKGGDAEPVEYEHEFDANDPPLLAYGSDDGKLYIVGGKYYVTKHGIVK